MSLVRIFAEHVSNRVIGDLLYDRDISTKLTDPEHVQLMDLKSGYSLDWEAVKNIYFDCGRDIKKTEKICDLAMKQGVSSYYDIWRLNLKNMV